MVQWWLWEPFSCCLLRSGTPAFSLWEWLRAPLPPACMPPRLDCLFPVYKAAPSLHNEKVVSRVGRGLGPFPGSQPICSQHPEPQLLCMGWRESKVYLSLLAEYSLKKFPNKTWCYTPSTWHCGVCLPLLLYIIAPSLSFTTDIVSDVCFHTWGVTFTEPNRPIFPMIGWLAEEGFPHPNHTNI